MRSEHWRLLADTVAGRNRSLPSGLIIDSPLLPGYIGADTVDFFARPETWMAAYRRIKDDVPSMVFLPDWWVEYGMATEPSGFGGKIVFQKDAPPNMVPIVRDADDADGLEALKVPDPRRDGLMPLVLSLQRHLLPRIHDLGEEVRIVSARGPLTIASHVMGVSEFLVLLKIDPDAARGLLEKTSELCVRWLQAQLENIKEAEGVLMLDDISGFLGEKDYLEFAHPYLKKVFDAFPEKMRIFHNDTDNDTIFPHVADIGAQIFNPTHKKPIARTRALVGPEVAILGAVPPLLLAEGTPDEVRAEARRQMAEYKAANGGSLRRLILSTGGGAPMGARRENIQALAEAAEGVPVD